MYNGHMQVPAGKFKATCLRLMDRVAATGEPIVITKRGKPLARLVPFREEHPKRHSRYGSGKGTILFMAPDEELMAPFAETWDALA